MRSLEKFDKEKFYEGLQTYNIGRNITHLDSIDSTNLEAKRRLKHGLKTGSIIISDVQVNGVGRFKRKWSSPNGGLWFTIILKPKILTKEAPKITLIAGASINKALKKHNILTKIKWPNDIYLNDKKICGILAEMKEENIILGIGLNVNIDKKEIDENIMTTATSLKIEFNKEFDKYKILIDILNIFEELYNDFVLYNKLDEVISINKKNSYIFGKKADLIIGRNIEEVTCVDISKSGNLIIRDKEGISREIFSGEISFKNK